MIKFDSKVFDKDTILYAINLYDMDFDISFQDENWIVSSETQLDEDIIKNIKNTVQEQQLRKDISMENKKIREHIIAAALGVPNQTN